MIQERRFGALRPQAPLELETDRLAPVAPTERSDRSATEPPAPRRSTHKPQPFAVPELPETGEIVDQMPIAVVARGANWTSRVEAEALRLVALVPNEVAGWYASRFVGLDDRERRRVHGIIVRMGEEGKLAKTTVGKSVEYRPSKRDPRLLYWKDDDGQEQADLLGFRELADHSENVNRLSASTIYRRVEAGKSVNEALAEPAARRGAPGQKRRRKGEA